LVVVAATVALTVAAAVAALGFDRSPDAEPVGAGPVGAGPSPSMSSAFNATDAAWLQLMIALDEGGLRLVDAAAQRASDGALRSLVQDIGVSHRTELAELRRLGALANLPATNEHDGHEMPGMVTVARLAKIEALPGESFDQTVRETLREHLQQCVNLAGSEQKSGSEPETVRLAARIAEHHTAHLRRL
jgi:uncharacterized protein (DUF305 family)